MSNRTLIICLIIFLVFSGGGAFYGGRDYGYRYGGGGMGLAIVLLIILLLAGVI